MKAKIFNSIVNPDALEKWFAALVAVIKSGKVMLGIGGLNRAWAVCKSENPRLYDAAFGSVKSAESAGELDEGDAHAALNTVGEIANRIKEISGRDFRFGWNFVRDELPDIFNRQFSAQQQVSNQQGQARDARAVQKKAALEFERLTNKEIFAMGISRSHAMTRVMNREHTLYDLATEKISPAEAFEQEPALRNRLK
jgi:hypothetical protein